MDKSAITIALAADHAGFGLKTSLLSWLEAQGYAVIDLGTGSEESVDYPDYGQALAKLMADKKADFGIGICGSGIGMSIALNRHPKIRAALCGDAQTAALARKHNDANVLVLGGRVTPLTVAQECVATFLSTAFEGGRHGPRVEKLFSCGGE